MGIWLYRMHMGVWWDIVRECVCGELTDHVKKYMSKSIIGILFCRMHICAIVVFQCLTRVTFHEWPFMHTKIYLFFMVQCNT